MAALGEKVSEPISEFGRDKANKNVSTELSC